MTDDDVEVIDGSVVTEIVDWILLESTLSSSSIYMSINKEMITKANSGLCFSSFLFILNSDGLGFHTTLSKEKWQKLSGSGRKNFSRASSWFSLVAINCDNTNDLPETELWIPFFSLQYNKSTREESEDEHDDITEKVEGSFYIPCSLGFFIHSNVLLQWNDSDNQYYCIVFPKDKNE